MQPFAILWPTFVLVALVFVVTLVMFAQRMRHMKANPPRPEDFASGAAALRYFQPVEMPANNYRNLFEMPVLYFALVPLLLVTHQASLVQVVLAWVYVVLRAAHSAIHLGSNKVPARFGAYLLSMVVLAAMWVGFAVDIAGAAATVAAVGR